MKSFLEGRPQVSRHESPLNRGGSQLPAFGAGSPVAPHVSAPASPESAARREVCEKKVETVTQAGVVQKIIVTCSCGERIEVHCGY